mmetsp:Transcript_16206/g.45165  ORF Transcript_16206/g.45165 Transcript_16206/m.45165 type:complete len:108 (-) Transcript_16206:649-972(-)
MEPHKQLLKELMSDVSTAHGRQRDGSSRPQLPPYLLRMKGDLANLQREILGAAIPDKLCNSLGGLLVRMPHGKRAALYNGITCLGFHSLLDFLYQACTAAECLQQRQ